MLKSETWTLGRAHGTYLLRIGQTQDRRPRPGRNSIEPESRLNPFTVKSGDIQTPRDITRLTIVVNETPAILDFKPVEVEECESIVAGETWHKIAAFLKGLTVKRG